MAIPRLIHRIWFGPEPVPDDYLEFGRLWERYGYRVWQWTEQNLPPLRNQDIYDAIPERGVNVGGGNPTTGVWVQRADVVQYELVDRFGGIYANMDLEPVRDVHELLDGVTAFAGIEQGRIVGSAIVGATAGHPWIRSCVRSVRARWFGMPDGIMSEQTGPHLVTAVSDARVWPGLRIFPQEVFYATQPGELPVRDGRVWCVHHWGHRRAHCRP